MMGWVTDAFLILTGKFTDKYGIIRRAKHADAQRGGADLDKNIEAREDDGRERLTYNKMYATTVFD